MVMRVGTLRRYAAQAGFRSVEVLPIELLACQLRVCMRCASHTIA